MKDRGSFWTSCGKKNKCEVYAQPRGASLLPHILITRTAHPACICSESFASKAIIGAALASASHALPSRSIAAGQHAAELVPWHHGATGSAARGGCSSSIRTKWVLTRCGASLMRGVSRPGWPEAMPAIHSKNQIT